MESTAFILSTYSNMWWTLSWCCAVQF